MKKLPTLIAALSAAALAALLIMACGTKTDSQVEKTTVIEKEVPVSSPPQNVIIHEQPAPPPEPKKGVSVTVEGDGENTHYEVHGSN